MVTARATRVRSVVPAVGSLAVSRASGDVWVFWALGAAFLAVGVHLFLFGRRRRKMLHRFARGHALSYDPDPSDALEEEMNRAFRLDEVGFVRAFMRVRDTVGDGRIRVFRCVELLDLDRWGSGQNPHHNRIAALFPADPALRHWSMHGRDAHRLDGVVPKGHMDPAVSERVEATLSEHPPRCPISLTVSGGLGLLYLEPTMVGSETEADVEYLFTLADELARRLARGSGPTPTSSS